MIAIPEGDLRAIIDRAPNQRLRLLAMYPYAGDQGLTDEEAAAAAKVSGRSCSWKRCGELRADRCIEQQVRDGVPVTRKGDAGVDRIVCMITPVGRAVLRTYDLLLADTPAEAS